MNETLTCRFASLDNFLAIIIIVLTSTYIATNVSPGLGILFACLTYTTFLIFIHQKIWRPQP